MGQHVYGYLLTVSLTDSGEEVVLNWEGQGVKFIFAPHEARALAELLIRNAADAAREVEA